MAGAMWRRYNWLDGLAIPLLSAAMRAAWMAPLIYLALNNALVSPPAVRFAAWLVWGLLLGGAAASWALRTQRGARVRAALAGLIAILLVCSILFEADTAAPLAWVRGLVAAMTDLESGIHPAWLAIPITAVLWARGATIEFDDFDGLWASFRTGIAALVLAVLVSRSSLVAAPERLDLFASISAFLLWGFLSLALAAVSRALWLERFHNGRAPALSRHWLLVVSAVLAVVVLGGMLLGQLFAPEAAERLRLLLGVILGVVGRGIALLATGLFYIIFWLIGPLLGRLRSQLQPFEPRANEHMPNFQEQFEQLTPEQAQPAENAAASGVTLLILLAVGVAVLLLIFWRRRRRSRPTAVDETRELIWSRELMLEQLRGLFRRRPKRQPLAPYLDLGGLDAPRQRIRRAYQQLLAATRQQDWARLRGQTPSAYRTMLESRLPAAAEPLAALTASYLVARYAAEEPTEAQAADAEAALARIQQALAALE
jgi:hypothetical protein